MHSHALFCVAISFTSADAVSRVQFAEPSSLRRVQTNTNRQFNPLCIWIMIASFLFFVVFVFVPPCQTHLATFIKHFIEQQSIAAPIVLLARFPLIIHTDASCNSHLPTCMTLFSCFVFLQRAGVEQDGEAAAHDGASRHVSGEDDGEADASRHASGEDDGEADASRHPRCPSLSIYFNLHVLTHIGAPSCIRKSYCSVRRKRRRLRELPPCPIVDAFIEKITHGQESLPDYCCMCCTAWLVISAFGFALGQLSCRDR